jgi:recombinational DNA repair protein RecT
MEQTPAPRPQAQLSPRQQFGRTVEALAQRELSNLFASDVGKQAAARVGLAFRAAASAAKNPDDFYACSPESVAAAMATSAFTSIMPGGPFPGCYLIPKRVNGVQTLQWWINHRGIKTLARRAGQVVEAIPYFEGDDVRIIRGQSWSVDVIPGPETNRAGLDRLAGVVYFVSDLSTGHLLAARKVERADIIKRKNKGQGGQVWSEWPLEMAEKTAIKFAAARGDLIFDDLGNMALSRDAEATAEDEPQTSTTPAAPRYQIPEASPEIALEPVSDREHATT